MAGALNCPELADRARRQLATDGLDGDLAVVSGGLDGIERVLAAHLGPGDRVAVEDPGFTGVLDLLSALGLAVEPVRSTRSARFPVISTAPCGAGAGGRADSSSAEPDRCGDERGASARRPLDPRPAP